MLIRKQQEAEPFLRRVSRRWRSVFAVFIALMVLSGSFVAGYVYHRAGNSLALLYGLIRSPFSTAGNYAGGMLLSNPERITIDIKQKNFEKLAYKRQESIERGYLRESADDWVPATIGHDGEVYDVRMRLKGDLEDHWKFADHWSFKFEVKDGKTIFGMKRFAIQHPRTRNYLNEWLFHELFKYCGLISLRYDFIDVTINGKSQSIYAVEENFDKLLVENNSLREGPVFRFESDHLIHNAQLDVMPRFQGAVITPYSLSRIQRDELLSGQFKIALSLVESFRENRLRTSQVFDSKKLAMFFAILDLTGHKHATLLDNIRFYYNPVTSLIEPIGYDHQDILLLNDLSPYTIEGANKQVNLGRDEFYATEDWFAPLFSDEEFYKDYVSALERVSNKDFLSDFFDSVRQEQTERMRVLHRSYPWYAFEGESILSNNQEFIKNILNPVKSLRVYYNKISDFGNTLAINVLNIHALPSEVLGVADGDSVLSIPEQRPVLQAYEKNEPLNYVLLKFRAPKKYVWSEGALSDLKLQYRILGTGSIREAPIIPWRQELTDFAESDIVRQRANHREFKFLEVRESTKEILIKRGSWTINRNLILPKGYTIVCAQGTRLDLTDAAKVLSYSPFNFLGSEDSPIEISSSDSRGQGIIVLNAGRESILRHVAFENLSNPAQNGWELTGAITFYESPVSFSHCQFTRQRSEDALNIISSAFKIDNSTFSQNKFDAFDSDFSKGEIVNSYFIQCGNDAIDVSGTVLSLRNVSVDVAGDKGLSAGEKSVVTCENLQFRNVEIGVASKDLSEVTIEGINMISCKVGITAYQKKSEMGPSSVVVKRLVMEDIKVPYLIEKRSSAVVEGNVVGRDIENVAGMLYGAQYGKSSK